MTQTTYIFLEGENPTLMKSIYLPNNFWQRKTMDGKSKARSYFNKYLANVVPLIFLPKTFFAPDLLKLADLVVGKWAVVIHLQK